MRVLAIDQGTTSTRGFVLDAAGGRQLLHAHEQRQHHPQPGWVEQDPQELLDAVHACLARARDIDAVALANQGESCLAWDARDGRPLTPLIVWQDDRTRARCDALRAAGHEALSLQRCGLPLDPYFSASKLAWIVEHHPEARALQRNGQLRLGTSDAWFLERLGGRFVTDISTASRTGLLDLASGSWDTELCALHGVPGECLPQIVDSTGDFGQVACADGPVPLRASLVDQQAALYGHGCREAGDSKITFGTGAFALSLCDGAAPTARGNGPLPSVAWRLAGERTRYALDGGVYCASAALEWARNLGLFRDFRDIQSFAAPSALSRGLIFVPALAGLACPHWRRDARGVWQGLSLEHGPGDLVQSILEGIALRAAEALDAIAIQQPLRGELSIDGGMTRNPYFCQFLASVLQRPVNVSSDPELTSLGLAQLAAHSLGHTLPAQRQYQRYEPKAGVAEYRERFAGAVATVLE